MRWKAWATMPTVSDDRQERKIFMSENPAAAIKLPSVGRIFNSRTLHNCIQNIKREKRMMIVLSILHFVGLPLCLIISLITIGAAKAEPDLDIYMVIGCLALGAAILSGLACAVNAMPYLHKKTVVDMRLSLPMNSTQRFISDYLSGLFIYLAPFILNMIPAFLMIGIGHIFYDGRSFTRGSYTWYCDYFGEAFPIVLKSVAALILIMIMLYTLCIFVMTFCGSMLEDLSYMVLINCAIPGFCALICYLISESVTGIDESALLEKLLPYSSPLGAFIYIGAMLFDGDGISAGDFIAWTVKFFIVSAVFWTGSLLIYRRRRAEDTGKPVVYEVFYTVLMTLVLACLVFLFLLMDEDEIIPLILVTFLCYMILTVIKNRGFKKFGRSLITYVAIMAVSIGTFYLVSVTDGFGVGRYVPAASMVSSVKINYLGFGEIDQEDTRLYTYSYGRTGWYPVLRNRDSIKVITDIHKALIDKDRHSTNGSTVLNIEYTLIGGNTVKRSYSGVGADIISELIKIDNTEELKEARCEFYSQCIRTVRNDVEFARSNNNANNRYYRIQLSTGDYYDQVSDSISLFSFTSDSYEKLIDALTADIMAETDDKYFGRNGTRSYCLSIADLTIPINDGYNNTMAFLAAVNITDTPRTLETTYQAELNGRYSGNSVQLINYELARYISGQDTPAISSRNRLMYSVYDGDVPDGNFLMKDIDVYADINSSYSLMWDPKALAKLLANSTYHTVSEDSSFTVAVNDINYFVVDPRYNDLARDIYVDEVVGRFALDFDSSATQEDHDYSRMITNGAFLKYFCEYYKDKIIERAGIEVYDTMQEYIDFAYTNIVYER